MVTHNTFTGIDLSAYFKITKNLNMGAHPIYPIGYNQKFSGTIDGNNCTISNLRMINGWAGLVEIMSYGTIKNLGLTNIMINKDYAGGCVGGFCGFMEYSTITNCFISGGYIKSGGEVVGGIAGKSEHSSIINSYITNVSITMTPICQESNTYFSGYKSNGVIILDKPFAYIFKGYSGYMKKSTKIFSGNVAGLIGIDPTESSIINNCYAKVDIQVTNPYIVEYITTQNYSYSLISVDYKSSQFDGTDAQLEKAILNKEFIYNARLPITEEIYNNGVNSSNLKVEINTITGSRLPIYGLSGDKISIDNSYFCTSDPYSITAIPGASYNDRYVSASTLKTMASSHFGPMFSQADHINYGFPFLKAFYWETSV